VKLGREDGRKETIDLLNPDGTPEIGEDDKPKTKTITHPMSPGTLKTHRSALSSCWVAAMDRRAAAANPWRQVRVPRGQEFVPRLLTDAEVRSIVIHTPAQIRPLIAFLAETGLRLGEAQGLTWQRVDHDFGKITVAKSKSGRSRIVPTTARAREILTERWAVHVTPTDGPDLVFAPYGRSWIASLYKAACRAAGIGRGVRVHDLRHYVGTSLAQSGVPIPTIMRALGHSNISTTQRYAAHLPSDALASAFAALEAARGAAQAKTAATA